MTFNRENTQHLILGLNKLIICIIDYIWISYELGTIGPCDLCWKPSSFTTCSTAGFELMHGLSPSVLHDKADTNI